MAGVRRVALGLGLLLVLLAAGGIAVARGGPDLVASGPTSVAGTEATSVFTVGSRTLRQVRYDDGGTLRYTFRLSNHGSVPVDVVGVSATQRDARLFHRMTLTPAELGPGDSASLTLTLHMSGCETLSSRAGSFVSEVAVRTRRLGVLDDDVVVRLPEEIHTGSPREAFCPRSTATSRPPG